MHEFSIAENILETIEAQVDSGTRLHEVHLIVGPLSGVSADALEFCFTEVAQMRGWGSPTLTIDQPAARVHCLECGVHYEGRDFYEGCPECGSLHREILTGHECTVDWVRVEED